MIERLPFPKILPGGPQQPAIGVKERAFLECGCQVLVGRRLDTGEVSAVANPCGPEHRGLMEHFTLLMRESLVEPEDEELVVVCDRLLEQAEVYA